MQPGGCAGPALPCVQPWLLLSPLLHGRIGCLLLMSVDAIASKKQEEAEQEPTGRWDTQRDCLFPGFCHDLLCSDSARGGDA
jgi:hypothetical protein